MSETRKVQCPKCNAIVKYERDETGRWVGTVIGTAGGGVAGGILGSSIGIAALGTAISGLWPVALVGAAIMGTIGYFTGKSFETVTCPNCNAELKFE